MPVKPRVIYWFRTDLRLHDSPALQAALDLDPAVLYPIFTFDPAYVDLYKARAAPGPGPGPGQSTNRWQFLLDCLADLAASVSTVSGGESRLLVLRETPLTLLPRLATEWRATHLVFERDPAGDAHATQRDDAVLAMFARHSGDEEEDGEEDEGQRVGEQRGMGKNKKNNAGGERLSIEVITRNGRTLWDPAELVAANGGRPTMSIAQVQKAGARLGAVAKPLPAPAALPPIGDVDVAALEEGRREDRGEKTENPSAGIAGPAGDFAPPTLAELGLPEATTPHRGGESRALEGLDAALGRGGGAWAATFRKPATAPTQEVPRASTTVLSPFLHFGALSVRLFYWRAREVAEAYGQGGKGKASTPPESLEGQLLFRDMYFAAQAGLGADVFGRARGNAYCRFIPWHLPTKVAGNDDGDGGGDVDGDGLAYTVDRPEAQQWFLRWAAGTTGFPFVDAIMRQLRATGWVHHLARHMVACFLTRGGCYVDWERGAEVFAELLLDHEPACNAGNWQWLACAAFNHRYFRVYSPVAFGRRWDKEGDYVRRWVPELRGIADGRVYEPWTMGEGELRECGVVLRGDGLGEEEDGDAKGEDGGLHVYPKPMFDFGERRKICMAAMKKAYAAGLYGGDDRVMDGTWRELFAGDGEVLDAAEATHSDDDGERADDASEDDDRPPKRGARAGGSRTGKREAGQSTLDRHFAKRPRTRAG